eukprot:m.229660 g.229660  ORF g.229660 m.229660 type:complete len:131 (+) comp39192_c0_seq1:3-395(+)
MHTPRVHWGGSLGCVKSRGISVDSPTLTAPTRHDEHCTHCVRQARCPDEHGVVAERAACSWSEWWLSPSAPINVKMPRYDQEGKRRALKSMLVSDEPRLMELPTDAACAGLDGDECHTRDRAPTVRVESC